ncbi:hypothetical protein NL676_012563 [Syzygium grande]|nr:hypothetical protein NL676_012563 [Syzygium grande]
MLRTIRPADPFTVHHYDRGWMELTGSGNRAAEDYSRAREAFIAWRIHAAWLSHVRIPPTRDAPRASLESLQGIRSGHGGSRMSNGVLLQWPARASTRKGEKRKFLKAPDQVLEAEAPF